jgi:large subunit ribosomal protein L35
MWAIQKRSDKVPKAKTNKSLKKRFKLTGTGKLLRNQQNRSHIMTKKSSRRKRRLEGTVLVAKSFIKKFKRIMNGL